MKLRLMNSTKITNVLCWILFFVLIYIKYVVKIDFSSNLLLILYMIMAFCCNKEALIGLFLCCIPLFTSFHYYYAIIICIFVYLLKYYSQIRVDSSVSIIFLLWSWELFHCFSDGVSLNNSITFILPYIVAYLLMFSYSEDISYEYIVRLLAICTSFMCFVVLSKLLVYSGGDVNGLFRNMQRLGTINDIEEVGAYFNSNTLGYFCIMASCGLIQIALITKSRKLDIFLIIFLIICGFLTTSKTFIICFSLMLTLFAFTIKGTLISKLKKYFFIILIFAFVLLVMYRFFGSVIQNYIFRFSVNDISTGRLELFKQYNEYIFSSVKTLFWGTGLSAQRMMIDKYFGVSNFQVPHNGFQEIVVVWGITGLILFLAFLHVLIMHAKKKSTNKGLINYIPLILLLVKVQAGQLVTSFPTMLMFSLVYLSLCVDFDKKKQKIYVKEEGRT